MSDLIHVYDRLTGLKQHVPAGWLDIYPNLRRVPSERPTATGGLVGPTSIETPPGLVVPTTPAAITSSKKARRSAAVPIPSATTSGPAAHPED